MSDTNLRGRASGASLGRLALLVVATRSTVFRPSCAATLDGLSDHLLRDIGHARGAAGLDRLHRRDP